MKITMDKYADKSEQEISNILEDFRIYLESLGITLGVFEGKHTAKIITQQQYREYILSFIYSCRCIQDVYLVKASNSQDTLHFCAAASDDIAIRTVTFCGRTSNFDIKRKLSMEGFFSLVSMSVNLKICRDCFGTGKFLKRALQGEKSMYRERIVNFRGLRKKNK